MGWIAAGLLLLAGGGLWAEEPSEKAARYHRLLLKRPENKTIYERFYDAWLDEGTKEGLEKFLGAQAGEGGVSELWILAIYHQQAGRDEEALEALDQAVKKEAGNAGLLLARAKVNGRLLQFEKAIEDLDNVPKEDPEDQIEALKLKGGFLARAGRPEEGVKAWKDLLAANPDDEELVEDLIELEIGEGLYEEALEAATGLAEGTKDAYQRALRRLRVGEIQKLHGQSEDAVKTYSTVLDSTGQGTWLEREVLAQIDELFKRDDDFEGLKAFYEKTAKAQPQRLELKKALAGMTAEAGEVDEAVAMMRELMKLSPGDRSLREELVELLANYDREEDAAKELEKLLASDQKNVVLWERLADLRFKAGDKEGVKEALKSVDGLAGDGDEARLRVARVYERFELKEDAERILRTAAEGDSLEAQEALASFLMDAGREEDALAQWRAMAKGAKLDGLMRVARSLQARGKIVEAYEMMVERREDFGRDPVSLAMFCQIAQMSDHAGEALVEARKLVSLADQPTEIHDAVTVASRLIMRAGKEEAVLDGLGEKPSVNDLCLGAELCEMLGDSAGADAMLQRAEENGGGLLATTQRVQVLERRGDYTKAAMAMRTIVESEVGRRPVYRKRLVGLLRRAGNLEGALEEIERWKQATPGDKLAWMAQADVHVSAGEHEKAVTVLRRAQARFGREEEIQVQLADAYIETGEAAAAQHVFEKLYEDAEQSSDKVRWAARLAEVAEDAGTVDELLAAFDRRKRNNAKSIVPLLALAEIYNTLNRYDERRAALQEATRRRPKDLNLRFDLARVEERAGDLERAVESLKAARKHDRTGETQRHLARLLLRYGEVDEAMAMLRESDARKADPRDIEDMAEVMVEEQEWEAARDYLAPHVASNANDYRLRYLLALCAEELKEEERAVALFLELTQLTERQPLRGVKPILPQKDRDYWSKFGEVELPVRALQLNLVYFYLRHAYSHRVNQQRGFTGMGATVALPGDAQEAWALSICHLMNLVRAKQGEEREKLLAKLEASGIEDTELLLLSTDQSGARNSFVEVLQGMLEKEPDDTALLLLVLAVSAQETEKLDPKWIRAVREKFREEIPLIALFANQDLLRVGDEEAKTEAWKELHGLLKNLKGEDLVSGLNAVAGIVSGAAGFDVSDDQRKEMFGFLMERFRAKDTPRPYWTGLESSLMNYAASHDRYDEVVELMNGVCGEPLPVVKGAKINSRSRRPYYNGSLYSQIQSRTYRHSHQYQQLYGQVSRQYVAEAPALIPYPPTSLGTVPGGLLSQLRLAPEYEDQRLAAFVRRHSAKSAQLDRAKLKARLGAVNDSTLRLMILSSADNPEELAKGIEEASKKEDISYHEAIFVAGYYARKEADKLKAMTVLARVRAKPLNQNQAGTVDSYLLVLGADLHKKELLSEELVTVAKRAGLRVRRQPRLASAILQRQRSPFQRSTVTRTNPTNVISSALRTLGVSPRKVTLRAVASSSRSSRGTNKIGEEIGKLVEKGNRDAAVRRAARELERAQRVGSRSHRGSSTTSAQLVKVVEGLGLTDDALKHLDPGEEGGELRQTRYAVICQLFKRTDQARLAYERALEKNPKNSVAKARVFALMTPEERNQVLDGIELGEDAIDILKAMYGTSTGSSSDLKQVVEMMRTLTLLLEMTEPDGKATRDFSYVSYRALGLMKSYSFAGGVKIRKLTEKRTSGGKDNKDTVTMHSAFYDLCIAMLRHPQTAVQGFMLLHYTSEARGDDLRSLENEALVALAALAKTKVGPQTAMSHQSRWALQSQRGWSSSGSMTSSVPPPAEYLLWLAGQEDRPDLLDDDVVALVEKSAPVLGRRIKAYRDVLFKRGEERLEAFDVLQKSMAESSAIHTVTDIHAGIRILMTEAGKDPEFVDKLGESILDFKVDQYGRLPNSQVAYTVLPVYGHKLLELKGKKAFEDFLLSISTGVLGPRDEWDLVQKAYALGVQGIRTKGSTHNQLMDALIRKPETSLMTSAYVIRNELDRMGSGNNLQHYLQGAVRSQGLKDEDALKKFFEDGGFLTEAAKFDPLSYSGDPLNYQKTNTTLLEVVCAAARAASGSAKDEVAKVSEEWMKAEGEDQFARRLIGASLSREGDQEELVAEELVANLKVIEAMPIRQQVGLARYLSRWYGKTLQKAEFPAELEEWRDDVSQGGREQARQQVEDYLKNGFGGVSDYAARQAMQRTVLSSLNRDPELAAKLVGRYVKDFLEARANGNHGGAGFSNGLPVLPWDSGFRDLSYRWRNGEYTTPMLAKFVAELLKQPEVEILNFEAELARSLGASVRASMGTLDKLPEVIEIKAEKDKAKKNAAYWRKAVEALMKGTPEESEGIVAVGLAYYLMTYWSVSSEEFPSVIEASKGIQKDYPILAKALHFGARIRHSGNDDEGVALGRKALAKFLQEEKIPNELRYDFLGVFRSSSNVAWLRDGEVANGIAAILHRHGNGERNLVTRRVADMMPHLSNEETGATVEQCGALLKKLVVARETGNKSSGSSSTAFDRGLILLALRVGDDEQLRGLLGKKSPFKGDLALARQVLLAGKVDQLVTMQPARGEFYKRTITGGFDKSLEQALARSLPEVEPEAMRYRLACLFANLADAGEDESVPKENRSARLERLVADFASKAPKDSAARLELLNIFADVEGAPKELLAELRAEAGKVTLSHNIILKNTSFTGTDLVSRRAVQLRSTLVPHAVRLELREGEVKNAIKQFEGLAATVKVDQSASEAVRAFSGLLPKAVDGVVAGMLDPEVNKAELLPFIQILMKLGLNTKFQSESLTQNMVAIGVVIHAMAGAGAEYDELVANLPAAKKEIYEQTRKTYGLKSIFKFWGAQPSWNADQKMATRREILAALLNDQATCDREIKHMTDLSRLMQSDAFERDDLLAVIDELPVDHPRRAEFILEKAGVIGWHRAEEPKAIEEAGVDSQQELAEKNYALAIKLAEEAGNEAILSQAHLYHALFTSQIVKDSAKALEIVKAVKPDLLVERDQKIYDKETAEWKEAANKK